MFNLSHLQCRRSFIELLDEMNNKDRSILGNNKLAVIIPSYNEKENIRKIVSQIFSLVNNNAHVVIVDDNSPDGTKKVVSDLQKKYENLHMFLRKGKGGRGSAVIDGLRYALENIDPELFIEMDADFSHNPEEILNMLALSRPRAVVIASRYIKGGKILNVRLGRRILSYLANVLIKLILRNPIIDNTNGFRCYRRDAVKCLLQHKFISRGYILLSESATLLNENGFKFIEFPSLFINRTRGESNATISEFKNSLVCLLNIKRQFSRLN